MRYTSMIIAIAAITITITYANAVEATSRTSPRPFEAIVAEIGRFIGTRVARILCAILHEVHFAQSHVMKARVHLAHLRDP